MLPTAPELGVDVVLRDGSTLHVRPVRPDDRAGVRLLDPGAPSDLDADRHFVLVGESGGRIDAVARWERPAPSADRARVRFAIAVPLQDRGVGTRLLELLASVARAHRIRTFDAEVPVGHERMLRVFLDSGFEVAHRIEGGRFQIELTIEPTAVYETRAAERSQSAATASMKPFFEPRSVVVVGANRTRGKIGSEILHNLAAQHYTGRLFAVHPQAGAIDGVPAFPRVSDVPGEVDLAVIAVPADHVIPVVDDCVAKGVRALVVISAGFAETGPDGRALERLLVEKVRRAGVRLIGPNCMGIINTHPAVRLNATFSPVAPLEGRVALSTQSGALGLAILDYARRLNLGISTFASIGNKADVSGNDLIQYWADDPHTDVILLYLESFGNPSRFGQIARRVAESKPIVAMKAGWSTSGARAASSHTGALAASNAVVDGLFRQAGIIRTTTLEELFDVATLIAHQPVPGGYRVGVVTNAGGPGILAADACEAHGLELPPLDDRTLAALRTVLPRAASVANPVDMLASASPDHYQQATRLLAADPNIDSLLVIFIPPLVTRADEVARAIVAGAAGTTKPVLASFISARGAPAELGRIPSYEFPEAAVAALARVAAYGGWRRRVKGTVPPLAGVNREEARRIVEVALARGEGWLTPQEAHELTQAVGIPTAAARTAATVEQAVAAALALGYPVALKAIGPAILHKTEVGGVVLDLANEQALRDSVVSLQTRLGSRMTGVIVQRMVTGGVELLAGAVFDPTFGPLIACGSGGVLVDLLRDTTFRLHPLTDVDAADMLESLKGIVLLRGYRGQPPVDERAAVDVLLRISTLVECCPSIRELDINPLKVLPRGAVALDVRVRVGARTPARTDRRISY